MRLLVSIPLLLALFFLPAGTLAYWEAWVYLAVLLLPLFLALLYLLKNDPELLARRLRLREKEPEQKRIVRLWSIYLLLIYYYCVTNHGPVRGSWPHQRHGVAWSKARARSA